MPEDDDDVYPSNYAECIESVVEDVEQGINELGHTPGQALEWAYCEHQTSMLYQPEKTPMVLVAWAISALRYGVFDAQFRD